MPAYSKTVVAQLAQEPAQKPILGHVNMQIDSFIANSAAEDLRAIMRSLLSTGPPGTTAAFTKIARTRVERHTSRNLPAPSKMFTKDLKTGHGVPTQALWDTVSRARSFFGVGLGFGSLSILESIVQTARQYTFAVDSDMEDAMIVVDADIAQALQSCREQLASQDNLVKDRDGARASLNSLRKALLEYRDEVERWGGDFPLEKGVMSLEGWKHL